MMHEQIGTRINWLTSMDIFGVETYLLHSMDSDHILVISESALISVVTERDLLPSNSIL